MVITSVEIEALKELVAEGEIARLPREGAQGITLSAVLDLACWMKRGQPEVRLRDWAQSQFTGFQVLRVAMHWIVGLKVALDCDFHPRTVEFAAVTSGFARSNGFYFFQERFKASARQNGFGMSVAFALAGVLQELVDNVEQHSGFLGMAVEGLVGYHAYQGRMTFVVGDCGCGVLASLRSNPAWASLPDSAAALTAMIREHASRRVGLGEGEGIKQVFKSLADLNGWMRFRSGDAFIELRGDGSHREEFTGTAVPSLGLQISVTCSTNSINPGEEEMSIDNLT